MPSPARGATAGALAAATDPTPQQIRAAAARARTHDVVVVTTANAGQAGRTRQRALVQAVLRTSRRVVVAAVATPYDIALFPGAPTYLATYSNRPIALEALSGVLFGEVTPSGRLPVAIPDATAPGSDLYPIGHGLRYRP